MNIPIVGEMIVAMQESVAELCEEISDIVVTIQEDCGFVRFRFRGVGYEMPEPRDVLLGYGHPSERRYCLRAMLDHVAMPMP